MRWCNRRASPSCPAARPPEADRQKANTRAGLPSPAARRTTRGDTRDRTARTRNARPPFGRSLSSGLSALVPSLRRLLRLLLCRVLLDQLDGEELERVGDRNEEIDAGPRLVSR